MSSFDESLPMVLYRALDVVMPEFRELFGRHDLTEQQWRVLRVLWEAERIRSADLAARTLLPAPSLVGIIDRLEKRGLVGRVRSTTDRRVVYVMATDAGRSLGETVGPHVDSINNRIRSSVTDAEWTAMETTLQRITAALQADPSNESDLQTDTDAAKSA